MKQTNVVWELFKVLIAILLGQGIELQQAKADFVVGNRLYKGGDHLAGTAPGGPKIHQHRTLVLQNLSIKIIFCQCNDHSHYLLCFIIQLILSYFNYCSSFASLRTSKS